MFLAPLQLYESFGCVCDRWGLGLRLEKDTSYKQPKSLIQISIHNIPCFVGIQQMRRLLIETRLTAIVSRTERILWFANRCALRNPTNSYVTFASFGKPFDWFLLAWLFGQFLGCCQERRRSLSFSFCLRRHWDGKPLCFENVRKRSPCLMLILLSGKDSTLDREYH